MREEKPIIVFENGGPAAARSYNYNEDLFFEIFGDLNCDVFDLFGRPLTRQAWKAETTPWYAIAATRGTEDITFTTDELPGMIEKIEQRFEATAAFDKIAAVA